MHRRAFLLCCGQAGAVHLGQTGVLASVSDVSVSVSSQLLPVAGDSRLPGWSSAFLTALMRSHPGA